MNTSSVRSPLIGIIKCLVALGLAEGLRTMLSIPSGPFDHPSAWGPVLGWLIIVFALLSLIDPIVSFFRRIPDTKPDLYTPAQAEMEAERRSTARGGREPHLP